VSKVEIEGTVTEIAATGRKPWVKPAATAEKVRDITGIIGGGTTDAIACHS
jgi:hypothetical protein